MQSLVYFLVIFSSVLGAIGQVFFKLGSNRITGLNFQSLLNLPLIVGLFFYGLATIIYVFCLKNGELSVLYPLIACSYAFVGLLSYFVLKEPVSLTNFFGFAVIVIGVALAVHR